MEALIIKIEGEKVDVKISGNVGLIADATAKAMLESEEVAKLLCAAVALYSVQKLGMEL